MARARRVGLFSREIIERLSSAAQAMLISSADRLSEGQLHRDGQFYGSTMLSVDLQQLRGRLSDACDVRTALKLSRMMADDDAVRSQIETIACSEAERVAGRPLGRCEVDIRIRAEGCWVFIDIDVEGSVGQKSETGR